MRRGAGPALFFALLAGLLFGSSQVAAASLRWSRSTASPQRAGSAAPDAPLHAVCGPPERPLSEVAAAVVSRRISGHRALDDHQLQELARAAGVPQPSPRAWLLAGSHAPEEVTARLERWVGSWALSSEVPRRCGIARGADSDGKPVLAVVAVEALADLSPLPRRARVSKWLSLDAALHVAADSAHVVLLGPRGRPRRVLTSLAEGRVRSRFSLDQPGRWLVQVLGVVAGGPVPLLEAEVFVDATPPSRLDEPRKEKDGGDHSLLALLNGARRKERIAPLSHDANLDAIAREHARAMVRAGRVAHDVGQGSPDERVEAFGVVAQRVGENLARAPTVARLHRALWESPSHRDNLLDPDFSRVGIAMVKDAGGRLWAVQLFAR